MSKKKSSEKENLQLFNPDYADTFKIPIHTTQIPAGFPSPAEDHIDKKLDLNEYVIRNPASTFFVRVTGQSMIDAGINEGDVLVVDRSIEAVNNRIVVCVINGEFTVKRLKKTGGRVFLHPENEKYKPIEILPDMDFRVWGVVTYTIHKM